MDVKERSRGERRVIAALYAILCHGLFAVAVLAMARGLFLGMTTGLGRFEGTAAIVANALLVLQFPLVHSWLLARPGRRVLGRMAPRDLVRTLGPTLYVTVASAQVAALFLLWSPIGTPFWEATGGLRVAAWGLTAASWLLLGKSMADANLALQTGALGWLALWRGKDPEYGNLPTGGLFALCRQPIYLSFAAITWFGPVWTIDHVVVTAALTGYCAVGPLLKERRFARIHGEAWESYRARVPYFPGLPKKRCAAAVDAPAGVRVP